MLSKMSKRQLFLLSSSNVHGYGYLEHSRKQLEIFLQKNNVKNILFVPFAANDHNDYVQRVADVFTKWGYGVDGLHTFPDQISAVKKAEAIFIGGGNTFVLLKTLYDNKLMEIIRERVIVDGIPYIGSSAGTNVATRSIHTTNDMPVVLPPTFDALNLVPFNINPHFMDTDPGSKHKGETREMRLLEFHEYNETPVLALREGTALIVNGMSAELIGDFNARLFKKDTEPTEYKPESDLSFLLQTN